jgi:hypothetical protein
MDGKGARCGRSHNKSRIHKKQLQRGLIAGAAAAGFVPWLGDSDGTATKRQVARIVPLQFDFTRSAL